MEMNNFRMGSHVAQKSRRDKLRVQQSSDPNQPLYDYTYDPNVFPSEMINFASRNSHFYASPNDVSVVHQGHVSNLVDRPNGESFANLSHPSSSKVSIDLQNCGSWRSVASPSPGSDWVASYPNNASNFEQNNQNPLLNPTISSQLFVKPLAYAYHQDEHSTLNIPFGQISGNQNSQKHFGDFGSSFNPNSLQDVVTSANAISQTHVEEGNNVSNELVLLPTYGDQSNPSIWTNRPLEDLHHWNSDLGFVANKSARDSCATHGLALTLSSAPHMRTHGGHFGDGNECHDSRSRVVTIANEHLTSKAPKPELLLDSKASTGSKFNEIVRQNFVGVPAFPHRSSGPLGPFTGYATILKSSKYLKPTQQLLNDSCNVSGQICIQTNEVNPSKVSEDTRVSSGVLLSAETVLRAKGDDSGASSSAIYGSSEHVSGEVGGRSSSNESYRPEFQQKKAKLLHMLEEVCRRYKHYHQQMQMVVSSFETVAGLSAATPYISLALKAVSKHFRNLKSSILEQLSNTKKALGEDMSSPTTGTSSSKAGDKATTSTSTRPRSFDNNFQNNRSGGFFGPQQPAWRPQRGLPERAVSVLRAWLFDHFLHPYPTDTDKHMLATQTGLTRNQVSNWFINARVRIWKPMVEEIHTLETEGGLAESNPNPGNGSRSTTAAAARQASNEDQSANRHTTTSMSHKQAAWMDADVPNPQIWEQDKRSRLECQMPAGMDGSMVSFVPYQRGGYEMAGLGAVSLTLGLRQSAEHAQQLQQQEHQLRQQFGGQMIHDFVG